MIRDWLRSKLDDTPISLKLQVPARAKAANDTGWIPEHAAFSEFLPRTGYDYEAAVGDGLGSNVLMSAVGWVQRTLPEARVALIQDRKKDAEPVFEHPLLERIAEPNPYYCGDDLWKATIYGARYAMALAVLLSFGTCRTG
jgi:hypothetical protein